MSEHIEVLRRWLKEREEQQLLEAPIPFSVKRNEALIAAIAALEVAPLSLALMESARPLVLNLERLKDACR